MPKVVDRHGLPVAGQMPSVVSAIVVDNVDPTQLGRVRVQFVALPDDTESYWARLAMPMAGRERGWMTIPEIGDEVLVSFIHGDVQHAVVVGSLHNGVDLPPYSNEDGNNNLRVFQSRSGHRVTFDDTPGAERIELVSHNQEIQVVWDSANKVLSLYCGGDIEVEAKDHIEITTQVFALYASESITINASKGLVMNAGAASALVGSSGVKLLAPKVLIN